MKLRKVTIEAFRAYKYKIDGTFDFTVDGIKPSGFVSIYAPNGFGKSSFYDAVEWALTNNVSRYIGDTYKKNNELAAKGTKLEGVPQYILRNKDVERAVETSVVVSTTEKEYSRKMNNVRVDSRDIRFNDRDTEEGTKDFRNIILSQDAIDRFVREVKPEDRYDLFMEHFDGNAEEVRKSLHILVYENNSNLVGLNDRRAEISSEIVNGIDESVFVEYNNTIDSLVTAGENLHPISSDLTSVQELEIVSSILTRKHQLSLEVKHFDALVESLQQRFDRAGEMAELLLKKAHLEPEIKRINKGVEDSQKYQELLQLHRRKTDDHAVVLAKFNEFSELKTELPQFLGFHEFLEKSRKAREILRSLKADCESKFEREAYNLKSIEAAIGGLRLKLQDINELQLNASNIYVEIANARQLVSSLDSEIEVLDAKKNVDEASIEARRLELAQVNSIDVSVEGLLSSDTSSLTIDSSIVLELSELKSKLVTYEQHIEGLLNVQKALTEQSSTIERLVGLGLEYVSLHPTDVCPLCAHVHSGDAELKKAIAGNKVASDALQNNSKMIELSLVLKEEVEKRINQILTDILSKKVSVSDAVRELVQQLEESINKYQQHRLHISAQRSNALDKISSRNSLVFGLELSDLDVRLKLDKKSVSESLDKLVHDKDIAQLNVDALSAELVNLSGRMAVSQSQESSVKQTPLFIKFDEFIRINTTDADKLSVVLDDGISKHNVSMREIESELAELLGRCYSLKAQMELEGNWLDVSFLKSRQAELYSEGAHYDAQTLPYIRGIVELMGSVQLQTEAEFKGAIQEKLDSVRVSLDQANLVLVYYELLETKLKALVPFVQNIARRRELAQVEVEIDKHAKVALVLEGEMKRVTDCLETQIRSYFYTDLINSIYRKIDPHPAFKKVEFAPKFGVGERPQLNIVISDEKGYVVSPNLYFSSAQLNILSLSVFLARAIHAKHKGMPLGVILIDDPIHSMDSINVLSMIDMLRNISVQFDKQIIISTHDENFFELLQKKIPVEVFESKFITLESYGVVGKGGYSKGLMPSLSSQ